MSTCYWAIQGYGICVNDVTVETVTDEKGNEIDFYTNDLREICIDGNYEIYYTDNGDNEAYLLYVPSIYGEMTEVEKTFNNKEDVARKIYEYYKDYLTVDEQWVIDNIEFIDTYGCDC